MELALDVKIETDQFGFPLPEGIGECRRVWNWEVILNWRHVHAERLRIGKELRISATAPIGVEDGGEKSRDVVISGKSGEGLPAEYGILGHARDEASLETIKAIDALGRGDGPPSEPVRINSMTLRELE